MRWVVDSSGRFRLRPYYEQEELDAECERIVTGFLEAKYGRLSFPLSTDDLTVLVERDTSDLDLFADLSCEGDDVEGLTDYFPRKKPAVRIARQLTLDNSRDRRLRTTLAHEYGHVRFHAFLWEDTLPKTPEKSLAEKLSGQRQRYERIKAGLKTGSLSGSRPVSFSASPRPPWQRDNLGPRCRRNCIFDAPVFDWMEWQASYVCGAVLMPISPLRDLVKTSVKKWDDSIWLPVNPVHADELTRQVADVFAVSPDAARVRLSRLGILQSSQPNS